MPCGEPQGTVATQRQNRWARDEDMTQEERWLVKYNEVRDYIETNHRNPSRHFVENRNLLSWMKHQRKLMNAGKLKEERIEKFKKLLEMTERYKHVNQYQ